MPKRPSAWESEFKRAIRAGARAGVSRKNARLATAIAGTVAAVLISLIHGLSGSQPQEGAPKQAVTTAAQHSEGVLTARVVKVSDGDTIAVLKDGAQTKVRMIGIDAPEKSQPFGQTCQDKLAERIAGKEVSIEVVDRDRYGRALGKVLIQGQDINLAQIQSGCAWHYKQFSKNQSPADRELYSQEEIQARAKRQGLWQEPAPVEPWEFRRQS